MNEKPQHPAWSDEGIDALWGECQDTVHPLLPEVLARKFARAVAARAFEESAVLALGAHGAGANTKPQQVIAAAIRSRAREVGDGK